MRHNKRSVQPAVWITNRMLYVFGTTYISTPVPDWLTERTCMQSANSVQLVSATRQNSIKRVGASYQLELDSADSVATLR